MANEDGRTAAQLIQPFIKNSHRFGFYQSIRWLNIMSKKLQAEGLAPLKFKILPQLSLDFIGNDIRSASYDPEKNQVEMTVTFLALYGTASPLPTFYTEDLMLEVSEDITVSKDFLDIFHKVLYQKLYDVWLKYRLNQCVFENANESYITKLYHLIGLGDKTLRKMVPNPKSLIRYVGLFNQNPRSAKGLEILLRDYFEADVKIISGYRTVQNIAESQKACLGVANYQLGQDVYVGEQVQECGSSIAIELHQLSKKTFNLFSYKQSYALALAFLVKFFSNSPVKCFVSIYLKTGEIRSCQLGLKEWGKLGQNAWIAPVVNKTYSAHYELH